MYAIKKAATLSLTLCMAILLVSCDNSNNPNVDTNNNPYVEYNNEW